MKRVLVLVFLTVSFVSLSAFAQVRVAVGPKVGINFASISRNVGSTSGRTGMIFGSTLEIGFGKMFAVQIEPSYVMKGESGLRNGIPTTRALNFLEFPVLFKVKFLDGPIQLYSFFGPSLGITLSATEKPDNTGGIQGGNADTDISQIISGTDFGLAIGSGFEYKVASKVGLTFDSRYCFGLSNLFNAQFFGQTTGSNRGFQIQLGAMFYLTR
jgi:opacity protein-like surface antigen